MKRLTFVEIDLDYCSLRFREGACNAPAGDKCFNTKATCTARPAFARETVTLRFAKGSAYLAESGIDYVASCIEDVSFMPATVSLGENMGTRASLTVTMSDFPSADTGLGFDKYADERPYNPFEQGTFWGKFRARHPYIRGRAIRWIQGELGQTLEQMETRHFVMENFQSPTLDGRFSIEAKDALKMADGDRAKCPVPSRGFLVNDIDAAETTAQLGPAGVGNIEYPASGKIAIAGKEVCSFTRTGDTLTLVRGQDGTVAVGHKAQDRLQVCAVYVGKDPAEIIHDLLVNYAGVPAEYINLPNWKEETGAFLRRLYSRVIAEATSVDKLISELIEQAALSVWWDDINRTIQLRVLRKISTDAAIFDDTSVIQGSLKVTEQPQRRLSRVSTYFGIRTPLERVGDQTSYHSMQMDVDLESEDDYGNQAIKVINSSWIPQFGRPVAQSLNEKMLGRFVDPPRRFEFDTFSGRELEVPTLGRGYHLFARPMQTANGLQEGVPIQITRLRPHETGYSITADEMRFVDFSDDDLNSRTIIIDSNYYNFNWRTAYDHLYPPPTPEDEIVCIVAAGVIVGSQNHTVPSFVVGDWPPEVNLVLRILGRIQGQGGNGANAAWKTGVRGGEGGTALYTRRPVVVDQNNQLWGGGGGGASPWGTQSGGGGGGQGFIGGSGGEGRTGGTAQFGTSEAPGAGSSDGSRGGLAGQDAPSARGISGGAAGAAIDGNSFVTFLAGEGDIRGPRIN